MKKLKLFPKTYIFTMILMSMIILIAHTLLYILLPIFYTNSKQKELANISKMLVTKLENSNSEDSMEIAKKFAVKYKLNIMLTIDGETNVYDGTSKADIYINPDEIKNEELVFPEINNNIISYGLNNQLDGIESDLNYFKIKNSSILRKNNFNTLNGSNGEIKIIMDLQSFKEARRIVFMILPYSIGISLIISTIASYIYTKIITNPIKEICDVTKEMEELNKNAYCEISTGDEIEILSQNINSLYRKLWNTIYNLEHEIDNVSKSEKMKVDFLRSASHELKTPLMSIHIMLENMMLNIGKYKNHDVYLVKCKDEVNRLNNMVQDILNTSRLNTWNGDNEYKVINLKNVLEKAIESYKITAQYKHININTDYSNFISINTDESLLNKALSNIISNAVNYTDKGKNIEIYFNNNSLIIENECNPISKEDLDRIFEAFYRVEFDRNRNTGGNGLGLYIVKQILNTLDISYSFESTETGMKFTMTFK